MRKGYMVHLEAGLLGEGAATEVTVVDGDSILEEVAVGNEDIIPDGYTEIDGEMTVTENLTDAIEEEELIIEEVEKPMVEAGGDWRIEQKTVSDPNDDWVYYATPDGSKAAQFEHTFAITPDGPKILTLQKPYDGYEKYLPHFLDED